MLVAEDICLVLGIRVAASRAAGACPGDDEWGRIHLRQFFVVREARREDVGGEALRLLREAVVPGRRLLVEVLAHNEAGKAFWLASGFREYALTLELPADAP